jgi:O-antigen/teichoic acid export membrane protein
MVVSFFLSPFVVHRLGNTVYGIWVLTISTINYLSLLDLGMRSSVLRFVSKSHTKGDDEGASDAFSAALWVRLQISVAVLLASAGLAVAFNKIFHVPTSLIGDARLAVMIMGSSMALNMSMGVFGGVLSGLNRYDLNSLITLTQLTIRVIGVIAVLRSGKGIVAIACCELTAALVGNLLLVFVTRRIYPNLKIHLGKPKREVLRQLWSYSFYVFVVTVAIQLVYQTDNIVVGAFVSVASVTFYSIGNSLCRYTDQLVTAITLTFVPAASTYEAGGDTEKLAGLYQNGTRAIMMVALPVIVTLITRGRTFIGLWMGPMYEQVSGTVLLILATALLFSVANGTGSAIAYGIEKHQTLAKWAFVEGISNLTLSILLAHKMGIYGVALGTMIPSLLIHVVWWPFYFSRVVGFGGPRTVWGVWIPMFLAATPFAAVSYLVNRMFPPGNIASFLFQTILLLPVFYLAVVLIFRDYVRGQIFPRIRSLFATNAG